MSKNTKAGSLRPVLSMLILFGPALLLILISTRGCKHEFQKLDDYGKLPSYNYTDAAGKSVKNSDYKNKIVLYTVIQSSCPDTCSISLWHLDQLIYQQLRENRKRMGHVKMVSVVIDAQGNPSDKIGEVQATLKRFVEGYDPEIWQIVKGDPKIIYNISHNGKSLMEKGKKYFAGEAYTELLMLVDKSNHVRMVLPAKTESTIREMRERIALLEGEYDRNAARAKRK